MRCLAALHNSVSVDFVRGDLGAVSALQDLSSVAAVLESGAITTILLSCGMQIADGHPRSRASTSDMFGESSPPALWKVDRTHSPAGCIPNDESCFDGVSVSWN